jgi:hypothetical protein
MVNLDTQSIVNEIDYYGSTVTVRSISSATYSDWGDATNTTSDASAKAFVQILQRDDELVQEGVFVPGDKIFWFKYNQTGLTPRNQIIHDSKTYEIVMADKHNVADVTYLVEVRTKRI